MTLPFRVNGHLVQETIHRNDSNKFIYILNQIDTTAREDNAEDVVASWQRALASKGLTAGRFFRTYSRSTFMPIENPNVRARYEAKRDLELAEIERRIHQVSVDRSYRIVGALERSLLDMEEKVIPRLRNMIQQWRSAVLIIWGGLLLLSVVTLAMLQVTLAQISGVVNWITENSWLQWISIALLVIGLGWIHFQVRNLAAWGVALWTRRTLSNEEFLENYLAAFAKNTRWMRSTLLKE